MSHNSGVGKLRIAIMSDDTAMVHHLLDVHGRDLVANAKELIMLSIQHGNSQLAIEIGEYFQEFSND